MTAKVPRYSPLLALFRKFLLWVALPVTLIVAILVATNEASQQRSADRLIDGMARTNDRNPGTIAGRDRADEAVRQIENRLKDLPRKD